MKITKNLIGASKGTIKPEGIVIHYDASGSSESTIRHLKNQGLGYHFLLPRRGEIIQLAETNEKLYHAGRSKWGMYENLNDHFLGICFCSWGLLKKRDNKYFAYPKRWTYQVNLNDSEVIKCPSLNPLRRPCHAAFVDKTERYWEKIRKPQWDNLLKLLKCFIELGIDIDLICGHDECSDSKIDPGGALSTSVNYLRSYLKQEVMEK